MKRHFIGLILVSVLALTGCEPAKNLDEGTNSDTEHPVAYASKQAIQYGDVVPNGVGQVSNLSTFIGFYDDVQAGTKDKVRITSYTDEGDPIFTALNFDSNVITYTFDDSKDRFAGPNTSFLTTTAKTVVTPFSALEVFATRVL